MYAASANWLKQTIQRIQRLKVKPKRLKLEDENPGRTPC